MALLRSVSYTHLFRWRLRKDQATEPEACGICVLDETHKLWGSIWEEEDRGPWSLLRSKRGSAILFPENIGLHGEKGVKVRNYIQINSSDEEKGVVHFAVSYTHLIYLCHQ